MSKFSVYAKTRAARQDAGDVAEKLLKDYESRDTIAAWRKVEGLLNDVECILESMDLKES